MPCRTTSLQMRLCSGEVSALTASKSDEAEQKQPHCTGRPKLYCSHASSL